MGENGNTENNYTLAWLQPSPDESVHLQPCCSPSPSEIFIMQKDGVWERAACCTHGREPWVELEKCSSALHSFCLKVPTTPASWKYRSDLHFYLILMYSSEVMISKYRGSLILCAVCKQRAMQVNSVEWCVFNRSKRKSGAVLCN